MPFHETDIMTIETFIPMLQNQSMEAKLINKFPEYMADSNTFSKECGQNVVSHPFYPPRTKQLPNMESSKKPYSSKCFSS
jgi:hypothetical protein